MRNHDKILVLFDFDGTLLKEDSLFLFLKFQKVSYYYLIVNLIIRLPVIVKRFISFGYKQALKESMLWVALKNESRSVNRIGEDFAKLILNTGTFNQEVYTKFLEYKKLPDYEVCIVSASPDIWIKPLAEHWGVRYICSVCEIKNEKFSGRFMGKNCNGKEKAEQLGHVYERNHYADIIAYGNNPKDDAAMFNWSSTAYLVKNNQLLRIK